MREDTVTTKVYPFDELSETAKEKAIEQLADINVNYNWWEFTYEDAAQVGIELVGFDIGRGSYCEGKFIEDAEDVAKKIVDQHGVYCPTRETATAFLVEVDTKQKEFENAEDYDPEYTEFYKSPEHEEIESEFLHDILENYRIMLQHEYEYMTSEEAIIETINANECEFTENGKLY